MVRRVLLLRAAAKSKAALGNPAAETPKHDLVLYAVLSKMNHHTQKRMVDGVSGDLFTKRQARNRGS